MSKSVVAIFLSQFLLFSSPLWANTEVLLIPMDESEEIVVLEQAHLTQDSQEDFDDFLSEVEKRDLDLLNDEHFSARDFINDHLTIQGQVSVTALIAEARVNVGANLANDRFEVGADAGAMIFSFFGIEEFFIPSAGIYTKYRVNPDSRATVYFKGRAFRAFNIDEKARNTHFEYGAGVELSDRGFIELSLKHFMIDDEDNGLIPFITMGLKLGGPKSSSTDRGELLFD